MSAPDRRPLLALAGLLLVVGLLYARGLGFGLVYDDPMLVGASRLTGSLADLPGVLTWDLWASTTQAENPDSGYYRPLFLLSLWVDRLGPPTTWLLAHRLQDLLWHLLVTGLVFSLARRWGAGAVGALAAAAAFALHPAQVAAVQFIAARNDLMATAFVLLALRVAGRPGGLRLGAVLMLCFAAVLSKESALLAPLLLAGLVAVEAPAEARWRRAGEVGLAGALGVGLALAMRTAAGVGFPAGAEGQGMLAVLGPALAHWGAVVAWPVDLAPGVNLNWPTPTPVAAALVGLALAVGVGLAGGRRGLALVAGGGLLLLPALAGVAGNGLMPDRYLYGPLALGAVGLALALRRLPRPAAALAGVGLAGALCLLSARTLPVWQSDATLWRAGARAHPQPFTWAAYGKALEAAGLLDEAAVFIGRAATGDPPMPHACFNATRIHLRRGAPAAAGPAGQAALDAGCPAVPELLSPMAIGQALSGDWAAAERTASWVGEDPTGQAVLVRCAAAARRGDLSVLQQTARGGGGDPAALQGQVAWLLRQAGEEASALAVEGAPLGG